MEEKYTQHGAFSWCELVTKDVNAAKTFYTKLFGWTTEDLAIQGTAYTIIKAGGKEIGGIIAEPGPMAWGAYVTVDDVDATAKSAEKLGAKLLTPPTDIPEVGRYCIIQDPQGAVIGAITYVGK